MALGKLNGPLAELADEARQWLEAIHGRLAEVVEALNIEVAEDEYRWVTFPTLETPGEDDLDPWTGDLPITVLQEGGGGNNELVRIGPPDPLTPFPIGYITATFDGDTTAAFAVSADAATVQAALEALASIGAGQVLVTGDPIAGWTIEFQGTLADTDVGPVTVDTSGLFNAPESFYSQVVEVPLGSAWLVQYATATGDSQGGTVSVGLDGDPIAYVEGNPVKTPRWVFGLGTPELASPGGVLLPSDGLYFPSGAKVHVALTFNGGDAAVNVKLQVRELAIE